MNIIVISRRLSRPRSFNLSRRAVWQPLIACTLGVALLIGSLGVVFGVWLGQMPQRQTLARLEANAEANSVELARLRAATNAHLNGLALRLGEVQAHSMRLNALGRRLTHMAGLDQGEFDFNRVPALGGPQTAQRMSALDVPSFDAALDGLSTRLAGQKRQLSVLEMLLLNRELKERLVPSGRPVASGWLSSAYGNRIDPFTGNTAWHGGIDFAGRAGTEIHAVADGVVVWSGKRYGYGQLVAIDHGNGYETRYAHNSEVMVEVGELVEKNQVISLMGSTGRATAPNLHFEVLLKGKTVNPYRFVSNN